MICLGFQGSFERGILSYITTYCNDYLEINDKYGRYYIICFYSGNILYRLTRQALYANTEPVWEVFIAWIVKLVILIIFIFYGDNKEILFILYTLIGISNGGCGPGLMCWGELIKPTTGIISAMWLVSYGIGDAIMSFTMGNLIQEYGAFLMPIIVTVPWGFGLILNAIAVITFRMIRKREELAFQEIQSPMSISPTSSTEK